MPRLGLAFVASYACGSVRADDPVPAEPPAVLTEPAPPAAGLPLSVVWKNGPEFATPGRRFVFRPAGRFQFDAAWYAGPAGVRNAVPGPTPLQDGADFRRARFGATGTYETDLEFNVEFDFANVAGNLVDPARSANTPAPTDVHLTFRRVPLVGNVRIGNQKPPISFEHITSSKYLNFLERSPGFDAFVEGFSNGFTQGIMAFDNFLPDDRGYWAVGAFKTTRSVFGYNVGRNETGLTARLVVLPVYTCGGERLVHLGFGATHKGLDDDLNRFRARFGVRSVPSAVAPFSADTGLLTGTTHQTLAPEFAAVRGPWSAQAEYYVAWQQGTGVPVAGAIVPAGTTFFHGGYAEVHYFLTGEHREYDHERMTFTRVTPRRPLKWTGPDRGPGAWQLAARYSYLDLNSGPVVGGVVHELTAGVNWFFTVNAKVQANYVLTARTATGNPAGDGLIHGFGIRTAWDF